MAKVIAKKKKEKDINERNNRSSFTKNYWLYSQL